MPYFDTILANYLTDDKITQIASASVGSLNAGELKNILTQLRTVLERANRVDQFFTNRVRINLNSELQPLTSMLDRLLAFDAAKESTPNQQLPAWVSDVTQRCDQIYDLVLPAVAMETNLDTVLIRNMETEASRILDKLQKTETIVGSQQASEASSHAASFFETRADEHKSLAKRYAIALAITVFVAILYSGLLLGPLLGNWKWNHLFTPQTLVDTLPTINLLAIMWFLIRLLARNLRNNQHLMITNQTKSIILKSGEQFSVSTLGSTVSGDILRKVIESTFTIDDTGYIPGESDGGPQGGARWVSLLRNMTSKN